MDLSAALYVVGAVLGLMVLGGALVYWPMSISAARASDRLDVALGKIKDLEDALTRAKAAVEHERALDDARDLPPADELGVLLRPPAAGTDA